MSFRTQSKIPPRPKESTPPSHTTPSYEIFSSNWDKSTLPKLALDHFGTELLEDYGGDSKNVLSDYKAGSVAKRHMSFFGWKDKTAFYDAKSWDLPYSLTPVSGLIASANPLVMEMNWEADPFHVRFCETVLSETIRNPKLELMHSSYLCSLPEVDVARLADLMVISAKGVPVDLVYPVFDNPDIYIYVISNDPRFQLLFSSFNHLLQKMPLKFKVAEIQETYDDDIFESMLEALSKIKVTIKLTNNLVEEKVLLQTLAPGHMQSDNPLFMMDQLESMASKPKVFVDPYTNTLFARKKSRQNASDLFTEVEEEE